MATEELTPEEYKEFYNEFDPHKVHGVRVAYAMHRAIYAALQLDLEGGVEDGVEFEALRLLRSWGFEVIELPFIPGSDEPSREPIPDLEDEPVYTKEGEQ